MLGGELMAREVKQIGHHIAKEGSRLVNLHTELALLVDDTMGVGGRWTRTVAGQLESPEEEVDELWIDKLTPIETNTSGMVSTGTSYKVVLRWVKLLDEDGHIDQVDIVETRLLVETLLCLVVRLTIQWPIQHTLLGG